MGLGDVYKRQPPRLATGPPLPFLAGDPSPSQLKRWRERVLSSLQVLLVRLRRCECLQRHLQVLPGPLADSSRFLRPPRPPRSLFPPHSLRRLHPPCCSTPGSRSPRRIEKCLALLALPVPSTASATLRESIQARACASCLFAGAFSFTASSEPRWPGACTPSAGRSVSVSFSPVITSRVPRLRRRRASRIEERLALFLLTNSLAISRGGSLAAASAFSLLANSCLLYTSPSPRDGLLSRMPSSA